MQPSTGFMLDVYITNFCCFLLQICSYDHPRFSGWEGPGWRPRDISWRSGVMTWLAVHGGYTPRDSLYIHRESRLDDGKNII